MASGYRDHVVELAARSGWGSGALVGLGSGRLLQMLLFGCPALRLIAVDQFARRDRRERIQRTISSGFADRCAIIESKSAAAADRVNDGALDFAWIDAGHKLGCVRADIRSWWPKVRYGGWIGGHDFCDDYPGVTEAVRARFGEAAVVVPEFSIWSVVKGES